MNNKYSKLTLYLCLIALMLILVSACIPTPQEHDQSSKDNDEYNSFSKLSDGLPLVWADSENFGVAEISIAARIHVPNVQSLNVYTAQNSDVRFDALEQMIRFFVRAPILTIPMQDEFGTPIKTKSDIEAEMRNVRDRIDKVDIYNPDFSEEEREDYIAAQQSELDSLAIEYSSAPDASERTITNLSKWVAENQIDYSQIKVYANDDPLLRGTLYLQNKKNNSGFTIEGLRTDNLTVSQKPISTVGDAKEIADQLMAELGLTNEYVFVSSSEGSGGISIYYGKSIHDVPFTRSVNCNITESYNSGFSQERIRFCFYRDGNSLSEISWNQPIEIVGIETQDCLMLSFPNLIERILSHLSNHLSWQPSEMKSIQIDITDLELGYRLVRMPNNSSLFRVVPAWTVVGSVRNEMILAGEQDSTIDNMRFPDSTIMVINAIDGSLLYFYQ